MMTDTVASLMVEAPILPSDATGETAYEVFSADPDLLVCAVVDRGEPRGLLTRDRFFLRMADRYGRALFSRRPVTFVMQDDPLLVPHDTPVEQLNAHILEARPAALLDGFIVTDEGRYLGVGSTLGLFTAAVRTTEQRSRELEKLAADLSEAERAARESARAKAEFLATMSHEIRTPLNGVLGLSSVLARTGLTQEQDRLVRTIHESGNTLLSLLNNILDLSKIEAGRCALNTESFTMARMAEDLRGLWGAQARERGLAYAVETSGPDRMAIEADLGRLRQVMFNLIGNALKFTHEGQVTARLMLEPCSTPNQGRLRMEVADTGIGVPDAAREAIFEAFSQADSTHTRKYGGTGLGLTICRRLIAMMDGEIGFHSTPGEGSTFWAEIPVHTAAKSVRQAA